MKTRVLKNILLLLTITSLLAITLEAKDRPTPLKGKAAIVVGASKGIGKSIVKRFTAAGAKVMMVSRDEKLLKETQRFIRKKGGIVSYMTGDVTKSEDMKRMVSEATKRYGHVDVLVYNTGIYPEASLETMTEEQWDEVMDVNLTGCFRAVKAVIPQMKKQGGGKILLTSSVSGPKVGLPLRSHYTASKAGMNGFMKTAAIELAPYNITINGIEPGTVMTEGVAAMGQAHINDTAKAIPMGNIGSVKDVADTMVFLASDNSRFMTGQTLVLDGGQTLPESHFELATLTQQKTH